MSAVNSDSMRAGASGAAGEYTIDQSIRFDKTTSSHLSKTYGSAGNRRTWTFSTWFKRGKIDSTRQTLFAATGLAYLQVGPDAASREMITILNEGSGTDLNWYTTQVFRDPSAWYHLVWQFDSTQATADDRTKLYINGVQVTDFTKAVTPALNLEGAINNTVEHKIGEIHIASYYFDGYQAEINFIDGTALDATSFGKTNADGVWVPIAYTGSYGTNGFYITGETASDLGEDFSGNNNDFTSSGLATNDQLTDSPTDDADNDVGNYATWNSAFQAISGVWGNGNLEYAHTSNHGQCLSTQPMLSGKYYFEADMSVVSLGQGTVGFYIDDGSAIGADSAWTSNSQVSGLDGSTWYHEGSSIGSVSPAPSAGDIIHYAYDADSRKYWVGDGGTWWNSGDPANDTSPLGTFTGTDPVFIFANSWNNASNRLDLNCGQLTFEQTPPSGFTQRVGTFSAAAPAVTDPSKYFQVHTFTGSGAEKAITLTDGAGGAVSPDKVWIKDRDSAVSHNVVDSVRGATLELNPDDNTSHETTVAQGVKSFDVSGFTLGTDSGYNASSSSNVAWCWVEGTTPGFDIVLYTGNGSARTISHGLGVKPQFIIVYDRDDGVNQPHPVYHEAIAATADIALNAPTGKTVSNRMWNNTEPTTAVFSLGTDNAVNRNGTTYVAYLFAGIEGFSRFNSWTGNGNANGTFVWCGFRPSFVMLKRTDSTGGWYIIDDERDGYNVDNDFLDAAAVDAEQTDDTTDLLSNGFKARTTNAGWNASGGTYVFMAFAKFPFGGSGVAQARAR